MNKKVLLFGLVFIFMFSFVNANPYTEVYNYNLTAGNTQYHIGDMTNYGLYYNENEYVTTNSQRNITTEDNQSLTIMGWYYINSSYRFSSIVSLYASDNYARIGLNVDGGSAGTTLGRLSFRNYQTYTTTNINLPLDRWVHIAQVYDSPTTMKIYIDGNLNYSTSTLGQPLKSIISIRLGRNYGVSNFKIDEFKLYNKGLTQSEVQAEKNSYFVANNSKLILYYPFNIYSNTINCIQYNLSDTSSSCGGISINYSSTTNINITDEDINTYATGSNSNYLVNFSIPNFNTTKQNISYMLDTGCINGDFIDTLSIGILGSTLFDKTKENNIVELSINNTNGGGIEVYYKNTSNQFQKLTTIGGVCGGYTEIKNDYLIYQNITFTTQLDNDGDNPTITINTGTDTGYLYKNNISINFTTTDGAYNYTNISLYNQTGLVSSYITTNSTELYTFNSLTNGTYYFNIRSYDNYGNYGEYTSNSIYIYLLSVTMTLKNIYNNSNIQNFNLTIGSNVYQTTTGSLTLTRNYLELIDYAITSDTYLPLSYNNKYLNIPNYQFNTSQAQVYFNIKEKITNTDLSGYIYIEDCYQETANISNCWGLDTGIYSFNNALNDANWSTSLSSVTGNYYINYTIPKIQQDFRTPLIWQVKDGGGTFNLSIPESVLFGGRWDNYMLRVRLDESLDYTYWDYYDQKDDIWVNVRTYTGNNIAYEEGVYWKLNQSDTLPFYLNAGNYNVTSYTTGYYNYTTQYTIPSLDTTTYSYYVYDSKINFSIYDSIKKVWINNITVQVEYPTLDIEEYNFSGNSTEIQALIGEQINISWTSQDGIADGYYIFTPTNVTHNIIVTGYTKNSIRINIFDADTTLRINENITIRITNETYVLTNSTIFGGFNYTDIPAGSYTIEFSGVNYTRQTYPITITEFSTQELNAYLTNSPLETIFTIKDSESKNVIEGATISVRRIINNSWTTIAVYTSDVTGRFSLIYKSNIGYRFTITKSGYETKEFTLDPVIFTSYNVWLTQTTTETDKQDLSGVNILYSPSVYYNNAQNNISFQFISGTGSLEEYTLTIEYNDTNVTLTGNNAIGGTLTYGLNISNANLGDRVRLIYTYELSNGAFKIYTLDYRIDNTNYKVSNKFDEKYGMGILDRTLLFLIILTICVGAGFMFSGIAGAVIMGLMICAYFMIISFVSYWVIVPTMIFMVILMIRGIGK